MKSRSLIAFAGFVALLLLLGWLYRPGVRNPRPIAPVRVAPARTAVPLPPAVAGTGDASTDEPSHLADALNAPGGDIHADLRILDEIFRQYRSSTHGTNPVGDNLDISAVLAGRNRLNFAFIPRSHPAFDAAGELCDRWGTPFFFHQLSGTQMEIHSAGPDRKLWTADDEVLSPDLQKPHL